MAATCPRDEAKIARLRWNSLNGWCVEHAPDDWPRDGATVEAIRTADADRGAVDLLRELFSGPPSGGPADRAWRADWDERARTLLRGQYVEDEPRLADDVSMVTKRASEGR